MSLYSIIVPVYRNEKNIPSLLEALRKLVTGLDTRSEVVFVVDGSPDQSYAVLKAALPHEKFDSQLIAHSRNFGSFAAIRTGLSHALGDYIGVMAADLQEPPELLSQMFVLLRRDQADVVFGQRIGRDDPALQRLSSALFWRLYRTFVLSDMPTGGVDIFACNRIVRDALLSLEEARSSIVIQLFWVGYRRAFVPYTRRKREHGTSGWSFRKRLDYMLDSIFSFTDLPIHILFWLGTLGIAVSLGVSDRRALRVAVRKDRRIRLYPHRSASHLPELSTDLRPWHHWLLSLAGFRKRKAATPDVRCLQ